MHKEPSLKHKMFQQWYFVNSVEEETKQIVLIVLIAGQY